MDNLRSRKIANATEPIVFTFDIDPMCKQYTFGVSQSNLSKNIEQNLFVLKNNPFWKNPSTEEVSSFQENNVNYIRNFGDEIFGKQILIFNTNNQSDSYFLIHSYDDKNKTMDYTIVNQQYEELTINDINIIYDIYLESQNEEESEKLFLDGKVFSNKNLSLTPFILQGMVFNSNVSFTESDEIYLSLENNETDDLIMLCSDYEYTLNEKDELNTTTIIPFVNDKMENIYYTNKTDYNKVRFVISNNGRYISHSTSNDNNIFKNNLGFLLSSESKDESNKNVSVRFSIDNKSYSTNLTSNF